VGAFIAGIVNGLKGQPKERQRSNKYYSGYSADPNIKNYRGESIYDPYGHNHCASCNKYVHTTETIVGECPKCVISKPFSLVITYGKSSSSQYANAQKQSQRVPGYKLEDDINTLTVSNAYTLYLHHYDIISVFDVVSNWVSHKTTLNGQPIDNRAVISILRYAEWLKRKNGCSDTVPKVIEESVKDSVADPDVYFSLYGNSKDCFSMSNDEAITFTHRWFKGVLNELEAVDYLDHTYDKVNGLFEPLWKYEQHFTPDYAELIDSLHGKCCSLVDDAVLNV